MYFFNYCCVTVQIIFSICFVWIRSLNLGSGTMHSERKNLLINRAIIIILLIYFFAKVCTVGISSSIPHEWNMWVPFYMMVLHLVILCLFIFRIKLGLMCYYIFVRITVKYLWRIYVWCARAIYFRLQMLGHLPHAEYEAYKSVLLLILFIFLFMWYLSYFVSFPITLTSVNTNVVFVIYTFICVSTQVL